MILASLALVAFILCASLTPVLRRALLKRAVLDIPNARSMHSQPVPRGGGLAVMLVILGGILMTPATYLTPASWPVLLAALVLVGVSWLDDRKGAGVALRFGAHILAAFLGSLAFGPEQNLFDGFLPLWLDRAVMILGWVWFINLTNFMDGIDGITGTQTIFVTAGIAGLLAFLNLSDDFTFALAALMIGACAGFLLHNWHPAKIFLGDVGSVPLGFLTGFLLLKLATQHHLAESLILPLYYLADSGLTLLARLLRGEKIWLPHRQHFYQRAAHAAGNPSRVVRGILLANLALVPAALLAIRAPLLGLAVGIVVVAVLLGWMHKVSCCSQAK